MHAFCIYVCIDIYIHVTVFCMYDIYILCIMYVCVLKISLCHIVTVSVVLSRTLWSSSSVDLHISFEAAGRPWLRRICVVWSWDGWKVSRRDGGTWGTWVVELQVADLAADHWVLIGSSLGPCKLSNDSRGQVQSFLSHIGVGNQKILKHQKQSREERGRISKLSKTL